MFLSKKVSVDPSRFILSEQDRINSKEYLVVLNGRSGFTPRSKSERHQLTYNYFEKAVDSKLFTLKLVPSGVVKVFYGQPLTDKIVVELNKVAESLDAKLLINPQQEYPRYKIIAAQKRLAKKVKELQVEYQKESFGGNNMWLVIRASEKEVMDFFRLKGEKKRWEEALENMHACTHMFLFEFRGWTFLAGQLVDSLFVEKGVTGEEAIEKLHVDKLLKWGKSFTDVQLYMHYDRSMHFNAFYRVLNGEIIYGEYESESYHKTYGKMPKNVKDLPDNNANMVAIEWSYEPDYLRFQKELKNANSRAVNIK